MSHIDIVRAEHLKNPPDGTPDNTLAFLLRLLHALPPEERAGLHRRPAPPAENVALYRGEWVGVSRIMYPDGRLVKVLGDVGPGAGGETPQWNEEEPIDPGRYVDVLGPVSEPPPAPPDPGSDVLAALERLRAEVGALTSRVEAFEALIGRQGSRLADFEHDQIALAERVENLAQAEYAVSGNTSRKFGHGHEVNLVAQRIR